MIIAITVKPNSKINSVEKDLEGNFVVRVKSAAQEGKANREVEHVLSEYFEVPVRDVTIISGHTSKKKRVLII